MKKPEKTSSKLIFKKVDLKKHLRAHKKFIENGKKLMVDLGKTNSVELVHKNR